MSADETYWEDYNSLQQTKHDLLDSYLKAWFPILATRNGRILYIDTHAGRGHHKTGQVGSPIRALKILLEHSARDKILSSAECQFIFFENDSESFQSLLKAIENLGVLPNRIKVNVYQNDYESILTKQVEILHQKHQRLAPTFAFVDPFGFTLPMRLLNQLLAFPKCELLINFMIRYVDMAIRGDADNSQNLDKLFGSNEWGEIRSISNYNTRIDKIMSLFSEGLKAKYVTHMQMRGKNGSLKYMLIHATNNNLGKTKFKEALWQVKPDGVFSAYERHNPAQMILIAPQPDLESLKRELQLQFGDKPMQMNNLYDWLVGTLYLNKHLHKAIGELHREELAIYSGYQGRFAFKNNPVIEIKASPSSTNVP